MAAQMKKVTVGIVGGTGYTGSELLRLLARHPQVEVKAITSRGEAGVAVAQLFPSLRGELDLAFTTPDESNLTTCDVVFFATLTVLQRHKPPSLLLLALKSSTWQPTFVCKT